MENFKRFCVYYWKLLDMAIKKSWSLKAKLSGIATVLISGVLGAGASQEMMDKVMTEWRALPVWVAFLPIACFCLWRVLWANFSKVAKLEDAVSTKTAWEEKERMIFIFRAMGSDLKLKLAATADTQIDGLNQEGEYQWAATVRQELFARVSPIDAAAFEHAVEKAADTTPYEGNFSKNFRIERLNLYLDKLMGIGERIRKEHDSFMQSISQDEELAK
jgi:hypothetical protein